MKHDAKLLLAVIAALGLPVAAHAASTLTQAQVTQIIKDVKTIDPSKGERAAVMKETLQGDQSMRTGIESRAELLFNDHTITRLGANTHFSFTEGTRNMSLQSGVMLLQVPKGIGGAKIETAAVTAAVTGTTIMVEAGKDYTKLIVLEGECCLWPKNDKKDNAFFKFKHKTCATAGQEIILRNGAKTIPDPVYVNLKVLESTSLLLTGNWGSPLNSGPINAAADGQTPGNYNPTNLAIVGAGTDVTIIQGQLPVTPPGPPAPPGGTTPPPVPPPGKYGPLFTIPHSAGFVIGGASTINTDPMIINGGVASYGRIYRGSILDGSPVDYLFGPGTPVNFPTLTVDSDFPNYGITAFRFTSLNIQGMPAFQMSGNGSTQLALVSLGDILISSANPFVLDFSQITQLDLFTNGGNIDIGANATITGLSKKLGLYSFGAGNNISIEGIVNLDGDFFATTQGSYTQSGNVDAGNNVAVTAGSYTQTGDIGDNSYLNTVSVTTQNALTVNGSITAYFIDLEAQGAFGGTGFLSASQVNLQGAGLMTLTETSGEGTTDDVNGVQLDMNVLQSLTITGNGINIPQGFSGGGNGEDVPAVDLTLYSNNNLTQSGTINIAGDIQVNSLYATADSDITASANITSNNELNLTSNNGDVTITGQDSATCFTIIGNNITTGSNSSLNAGNDGFGPITITSNGNNTVTLDGNISASTLNITGYNVHTLSTEVEAGITGDTAINIYATNNVTLDGNLNTSSLSVTGIDNGAVPGNVTIPSSATISADNVSIEAAIVDLEGFVGGYDNDNGSTLFSVDTSTSSVPIPVIGGSDGTQQDFYSLSGSGQIDAATIQVNSRGDLILGTTVVGESTVLILNGVQINPFQDLVELDLTGVTIEVPHGYTNSKFGSTLNLTSTGGDITIGGNINLGSSASEFAADASGNIVFGNNSTITAVSAELSGAQIDIGDHSLAINSHIANLSAGVIDTGSVGSLVITTFSGTVSTGQINTGSASSATINASNLTLSTSAVVGALTQSGTAAPGTFTLVETTTGTAPVAVGSVTINLSGSTPSLSVSANTLTVGNVDATSFTSFALGLGSANDINASGSATITKATSIALQVGVGATLSGSGSNISYNGGQLTIDDSKLSSFSVKGSSININTGFPSLPTTGLFLTSTGSGGNIIANIALNIASGNFTSNRGGITTQAITTGSGGGLTLTANNGAISTGGALQTGAGGSVTLTGSSVTTHGTVTTGSGGNLSITANNGNIVAFNSLTTTATGGITLTATNGNITADGTITTGSGGNLTINTSGANGNVYINNNLFIGGQFTATASGNIIIGSIDPTIGGLLNLQAGGAIEFDIDTSINGALTLEAGNFIHTPDSSTISGATGITLTLDDAPAEISEIKGEGSTLYFGVPSADESDGYGPLQISLNTVISDDSSVTATATSLTLTSAFNEPNISLSLTASDGPLTLNGAVTTSSFYGSSNFGDFTINNPVVASSYVDAYTHNGGSLIINDDVTTPSFYANVSNAISGEGEIIANSVTLLQGNGATLSQPSDDLLSFNGLGIDLNPDDSGATFIKISASPLTLSGALTLNGIDLTLSGEINTQGNTITARNVTLQNLQTVIGSAGNATNLNIAAVSLTLSNVTLNGSGSGNGGILTGATSGGSVDSGITTDAFLPDTSDITVNGAVSANGGSTGSAGGSGGAINLNAEEDFNLNSGPISANGGDGTSTGGSGGMVSLTSGVDTNLFDSVLANGGNASVSGAAGGNGGVVNVTSGAGGSIAVNGYLSASGGNAGSAGGSAGGNGGTINLLSGGDITVNNIIAASTGINGNTKWTGGNGGTVNITAQGQVNLNSTIEVSSSDLYANRVSAKGGNINVTSHAATGIAINVSDSGQLNALLNQGAPGPGGTITFLADKGGNIKVAGKVRADAGLINIQTGTADGTGPGGSVCLYGANLSADVIKVGSLGSNGVLTIGNNSVINGDTAIHLYAAGSNGTVNFTGNTLISGAAIKSIAGNTVSINSGVNVQVTGGAATVYTNNPQYNNLNTTNTSVGTFTGNGVATKPFAGRPAF